MRPHRSHIEEVLAAQYKSDSSKSGEAKSEASKRGIDAEAKLDASKRGIDAEAKSEASRPGIDAYPKSGPLRPHNDAYTYARERHKRMLQALKAEASRRGKRGIGAEEKCKTSNKGIDTEAKSEDSKGEAWRRVIDAARVIDAEAWRRDMDAFMQKHGVIYAAVQMEAMDSKRRRERQERRKTEEEHIKAISYVAGCSWEDATQAWQTFKAPAQSVLPPAPKWGQAPNPPEVSNQVPVQAPDAAPHLEKKKNPGYAAPHLTMVGSAQSRMEFFRKHS